MKFLTRKGFLIEEQGMSYLADTDPDRALGPLRAAACTYRIALGPRAGQKVLTLQTVPSQAAPPTQQRCVNAQGFSLHAEVCCAADQRKKLEHLCRYITRPAIANERLTLNRAGDVVLQLKSPYHDGTTHVVMSPLEFVQRLAALVPRPRLQLIRFHGVLAPNAKLRPEIIPNVPVNANTPSADHAEVPPPAAPASMSWAPLLKRVFEIDIEHCPRCGGPLKIIAAIEHPPVITKILPKVQEKSLKRHIAWLDKRIEEIETDLRQRLRASPAWRAKDDLLRSIPGVGDHDLRDAPRQTARVGHPGPQRHRRTRGPRPAGQRQRQTTGQAGHLGRDVPRYAACCTCRPSLPSDAIPSSTPSLNASRRPGNPLRWLSSPACTSYSAS